MRRAASRTPSASMSPMSSRRAILPIIASMASAFPKRSSTPPVSARPISPRSKASIAKAITPAVEIVSSP